MNKKTNIIRICIPAKIHTHTKCVMCLLQILNNFENETGYNIDIRFLCGKSNIDQARSMMATDFYNECNEGDIMLFIDSDHIFTILDIKHALAIGGDVSCGIYSNSVGNPTSFFINPQDFYNGKDNRILYAGTGFMMIRYNTLKILSKYFEDIGTPYANISAQYQKVIPFFKQLIIPTELNNSDNPNKMDWLGEDYSFCKIVRDCGLTIRGFLTNTLGHEVPNIRIFAPECSYLQNGPLILNKNNIDKYDENVIVYYCGNSRVPFSFNSKNCGGSEQSIFNVINKYYDNKIVHIYGNVIEEVKNNIHLINVNKFKLNLYYTNIILWRGFGLNILSLINGENIFIDLHDNTNPDLLKLNYLNKVEKVWFKSNWHRNIFSFIPEEKVLIRPNEISQIYYEVKKNITKIKKIPYRLCYTSCYTRGLIETLENCWMKIKEKYPLAEYHICYGFELINDIEILKKLEVLLKLPGIVHHGRISNYESALLKATSQIQLYLCTSLNSETDCLAVRESTLLNCKNILFNGGVFKEREGIKVNNYNEAFDAVCSIFDKN